MSHKNLYRRVWRWHFYAGVYVIPFFMMLASTGLVMVVTHLNESKFGEELYFENNGQYEQALVSPQAQIESAKAKFPNAVASQYIPSSAANKLSLIQMDNASGTLLVSVNPYTNEVVGSLNKNETLYYWANLIHGSLLLGDLGDLLIELAASLGILMLVTGIYLWLPRDENFLTALAPFNFMKEQKRETLKALHSKLGIYISIVLLFFLLSGLAWTNIWGGKFVQAWSTFPAEKAAPAGMEAEGGHHGAAPKENTIKTEVKTQHASLNHGAIKEEPWGLEQSVMPTSEIKDDHHNHHANKKNIRIDAVYQQALALGFGPKFRINLPKSEKGVYTISATSMVGDITYSQEERTVHLDQYSGNVLGDINFSDYSLAAKSMAVGIALHQGEFGLWNAIANILFCVSVLLLCVSGLWMWWMRKPQESGLLAAPPQVSQSKEENLPFFVVILAGALSVFVPVLGVALVLMFLADFVIGKFGDNSN